MVRARVIAVVLGVLSAGSLSCMPLLPGSDIDLSDQSVRVSFIHTSDIHSRLIPYDFSPLKTDQDLGLIPEMGPFGGATRMGALLKREREKNPRTLHVDSGDCFQGAPIFNQNLGEVEFKFLSQTRLDAAVIGNHEFDAGAANFVQKARDFAAFPLLAANYYWDDYHSPDSLETAKYTSPYTITNVNGVRVGIIGMANVSSLNSLVEGGNSLQATPLEQNEAARTYVELLKPMVDLVVIVSHLGLTEDQDVIQGYEAYYEYGRAKQFLECKKNPDGTIAGDAERPCRETNGWKLLQWYGPQDPSVRDASVVRVAIPGVSGIDIIFGGHLHVVLNPPQTIADPSGRKVLLVHSGAFAKFVGRLDTVIKMPPAGGSPEGAEILSHTYRIFPIDALWCDDAARKLYKEKFWDPGMFQRDPTVLKARQACTDQEDRLTTQLLQPYIVGMDFNLQLSSIFAYAPRDIARRNNSTGGDSPLGNIAADSMRKRRRVEAEVALTNSLGIRDNLYQGPLTQESMFNVFPFENTINIMYLSGVEMQEMFDFVADRSASRGCVSQAQISGARFTMDCYQVQLNDLRYSCKLSENGADCPARATEGHADWSCLADESTDGESGRCWAHTAIDVSVQNKPLDANGTYKIAVNDYIAKGGSGFSVLKRNTTRIETNIPLRDSLIGYMQGFCSCDEINQIPDPSNVTATSKTGVNCGNWNIAAQRYQIDAGELAYCHNAQSYEDNLAKKLGACTCQEILRGDEAACGGPITIEQRAECASVAGPWAGKCSCADALQASGNNPPPSAVLACGNVTQQLRNFCENPTAAAVAVGIEDGRIGQRVK